jgi:hypothetical protein
MDGPERTLFRAARDNTKRRTKKMRMTSKKNLLAVSLLAAVAAGVQAEGPNVSGFVDVGYNYNPNGQSPTSTGRLITCQTPSLSKMPNWGSMANWKMALATKWTSCMDMMPLW